MDRNERFIRVELAEAGRFFQGLDRWAAYYLDRRFNYVHAYALTTLFMLAAWLNRRPSEQVEALRERRQIQPGATVEVCHL